MSDERYTYGPFFYTIRNEDGMRRTYIDIGFSGMSSTFVRLEISYNSTYPRPIPVSKK